MHHFNTQIANLETIACRKQSIELGTVDAQFAHVEYRLECLLNQWNMRSDCNLAAKLLLNVRSCGEVIGMRMRLQNPIALELILANVRNQRIHRFRGCLATIGLELENGVNYGAAFRCWT
jgi:hypothetical protein